MTKADIISKPPTMFERITLAIIVPCYNEEEVLPHTNIKLTMLLKDMGEKGLVSKKSFILYVNDGSRDNTWKIIESVSKESENVRGISLSANRGHQNALLAGIEYALPMCDASVSIDADLQDDINAIPQMVSSFYNGADVVFGVRVQRDSDSWFKRNSALSFYKLMKKLGVECVYNHADFRLLSKRAMADLLEYGERNIFLRGIVARLGYNRDTVYYSRGAREAGESKYPFGKMLEFAIDGITSFSVKPVRMIFYLGLFFMITALAVGIYTLIRYFTGETIEGWASLMLSIWFCTGILLMGMGIMGEYIGKIYIEVKRRPRYKIDKEV